MFAAIAHIVSRFLAVTGRGALRLITVLAALGLASSFFDLIGLGLMFPLMAALVDPASLSKVMFVGRLAAWLGIEASMRAVLVLLVVMAGVFIAKNLFLAFLAHLQIRLTAVLRIEVTRRLMAAYLFAPYEVHLGASSSVRIRNISVLARSQIGSLFIALTTLLCDVLVGLAILGFMIAVQPWALLIGGLIIGLSLTLQRKVFAPTLERLGAESLELSRIERDILLQGLQSIKETVVNGCERYLLRRFTTYLHDAAKVERAVEFIGRLPPLVMETAVIAAITISVAVVVATSHGTPEAVASLAVLTGAALRLLPLANRVIANINLLNLHKEGIDALHAEFVHLGHATAPVEPPPRLPMRDGFAVSDIVFTHRSADEPTLKGISLTIARGEFVGIVGLSGAGKSTLADVLLGLLVPEQGSLTVDGRPVSDLAAWRQNLGYVPQQVYIFDDTLRRNVAMGQSDEDIDDERVWGALRKASLEEFARSLPEGLDTRLGELGGRFSGGQCQRVGIARALYREADVLILDEPTSALDLETEHEITQTLKRLKGERTLVVIAHRLTTIKDADKVALLEEGRLVDFGPFEALRARNANFLRLVEFAKVAERP